MSITEREERQAQEWIEEITGDTFRGATFADSLKDGVILCHLANKLKPGSVPKINDPATMPFKKMENIANYLKAVRALGMKEFEMFGTPDLFEEKNVNQVISSTHALGRLVQALFPDGRFPKLGIKVVEKNERKFTEEQMREARAAVSLLNLGSSDMGKKAAEDLLEGKVALMGVLGAPAKTPVKVVAPSPAPSPAFAAATVTTPAGAGAMPTQAATPVAAAPTPAPAAAPAPAPAASSSASSALPEGWEEATTDDGRTYYFNVTLNQTTWERPTAAPAAAAVDNDLPSGWESAVTDDGRTYYYNSGTGETSWDKPTGGGGAAALPPGWEEATTDDGTTYFFNSDLGITQWERPT